MIIASHCRFSVTGPPEPSFCNIDARGKAVLSASVQSESAVIGTINGGRSLFPDRPRPIAQRIARAGRWNLTN
jgi:hypothetical protein